MAATAAAICFCSDPPLDVVEPESEPEPEPDAPEEVVVVVVLVAVAEVVVIGLTSRFEFGSGPRGGAAGMFSR
jgi:hypothetical protein